MAGHPNTIAQMGQSCCKVFTPDAPADVRFIGFLGTYLCEEKECSKDERCHLQDGNQSSGEKGGLGELSAPLHKITVKLMIGMGDDLKI